MGFREYIPLGSGAMPRYKFMPKATKSLTEKVKVIILFDDAPSRYNIPIAKFHESMAYGSGVMARTHIYIYPRADSS